MVYYFCENFKSTPKMDSSCRHKFCHSLTSSSTANQSNVFTTAFSISPFFSLALGLRLGRCRSAPPRSALLFFFLFLYWSVTSVGLLRLRLFLLLVSAACPLRTRALAGDGGGEARCRRLHRDLEAGEKHQVLDLSHLPPSASGGEALPPV